MKSVASSVIMKTIVRWAEASARTGLSFAPEV
jgi:hypothetical protein